MRAKKKFVNKENDDFRYVQVFEVENDIEQEFNIEQIKSRIQIGMWFPTLFSNKK
jgi:hypothetical protein